MKHFLFALIFCLPLCLAAQIPDSMTVAKEVDSLLTSATDLRKAKKYKEALPLAQRAADISKQKWGEHNARYATSLYRLAIIYYFLEDFDEAEKLYKKTIAIRAVVLGKNHPDYVTALNGLGYLYWVSGYYAMSIPPYLEAKKIRKENLANDHPDYKTTVENLASAYLFNEDYDKAEPVYLELLDIIAKYRGKDQADYAVPLNTLAVLYMKKGDYAKAEPRFLEAIRIKTTTLGKEHPSLATSLDNYGSLYLQKGDYGKAESLFLEAKDIREKALGKEHPEYAASLNNLSILYSTKGEYSKAESFLLEAVEIKEKAFGQEHPHYVRALNNLAVLYSDQGNYAKAESLNLKLIEIRAKVPGREHPDYAVSLSNLASIYFKIGAYKKAELLNLEAKDLQAKILGKEHSEYAVSLNNLALLYQVTSRIPESTALFLEQNGLDRRLIEKAAAYSSESQMLAYLHTFDNVINQFYSFSQSWPSPEDIRTSFDNALFYNGYFLENARHLVRAVAKADSLTRDTFDRWQGCKRRLANEYAKPIAERRYVAETESEAEGYEKTLTRKLPIFGETRQAPHWQDVCKHLRKGEAAVEFIHYRYFKPEATDSTLYAALVLLPGDTCPHLVLLCEQRSLDSLLRLEHPDKRYERTSSGHSLYSLLWRPIESLLRGVDTVYYAPSGVLHGINFDAIMFSPGVDSTLIDRYKLVRLGSTRQLAAPVKADIVSNDALLFGGIRYEADSTAIQIQNHKNGLVMRGSSVEALIDADIVQQISPLTPLPSTLQEAEYVRQLMGQKKFKARMFTGFSASEEAFKHFADARSASGTSARVLHVATHGYFFPDPKSSRDRGKPGFSDEPVFRISEHPFLRSGLVLAGGNHAWQTGKPFKTGMEDGILTAYEISAMSLPNTELVVLSACETGLGDLSGNEGLYGLQRAFKIAGAQYLIMSLWKVPDEATKDLMLAFYRNWLDLGMDIPTAFRSAQLEMKKKNKDPEMWAGFILLQ